MTQVRRIKGMAAMRRHLGRDLAALRAHALEAVHEAAADGADAAIQMVPVAFGGLASSIRDIPRPTGATVRADAPHAAAVEAGARPHWAPILPLKRWCLLRGLPERAAYAVQVKISREGTRPHWYMRQAVPVVHAALAARMAAALRRELP